MKRYIRASIDPSAPDWLRRALQTDFGRDLVKRHHVALDRAQFLDHEPDSTNAIPIYHIKTDLSEKVYSPGVNDAAEVMLNGRWRKLGSVAKSKIPQMAVDTVWVDLSDPNNTFERKQKYEDPRYTYRYSNRGKYAGQYQREEYDRDTREYKKGDWSLAGMTPANESRARDKSGYKVPRPEDMIARYYSKFPERVTDKVESVYQRILEVRDELNSVDFRVADEYDRSNTRNAYSRLGDAIYQYKRLLSMLDENGNLNDRYGLREIYSQFSNQVRSIMSDLDDVEKYIGIK